MRAADNAYLIINPGVVLTPIVEPVIVALDQYFQSAGIRAKVTRALTDANGQLKVIQGFLVKKGLDKIYPAAMICKVTDKVGDQYVWQLAWSHLLFIGIVINPPLRAKCLMDYFGPRGDGPNKKGTEINATPHMNPVSTGKGCFDIGGAGGEDKTIKDELLVINVAFKKGVAGLVNVLPEHGNNCIHLDCIKI